MFEGKFTGAALERRKRLQRCAHSSALTCQIKCYFAPLAPPTPPAPPPDAPLAPLPPPEPPLSPPPVFPPVMPPGAAAVPHPAVAPPLLIPAVPDVQLMLLVPGAVVLVDLLVDWAIAGIANATDIIAAAPNPIRRFILCLLCYGDQTVRCQDKLHCRLSPSREAGREPRANAVAHRQSRLLPYVLAINDRQGLQMIAKEQPDLVFLDFMMPVRNGAGMLKAMMEDPVMAQIPVIIMSSLLEATLVAERAHGHVGFVRKPFQINTILDVAAATFRGSRKTSS